jgi:hypothetical protein
MTAEDAGGTGKLIALDQDEFCDFATKQNKKRRVRTTSNFLEQ